MQKEIKVVTGQSIYDIAYLCYNDASMVYTLIAENPQIDGINGEIVGMTLVYTPIETKKKEAVQNTLKVNKVVTIKLQQTLFDLYLQNYGTLDGFYDMIQNNSFLDSIITSGYNGNVLAPSGVDNYITKFFASNTISTGSKRITDVPVITPELLLLEDGDFLLLEDGYKIIL